MQESRLVPVLMVVLFCAALCPGAAAEAMAVPIVNPGFDADTLAPGSFEFSNVTGWDISGCCGTGIWHPTSSDYPEGAPSGQNVAYSNGAAIFQVLTTPLEANTRYVLQVEVGWNNHDPFAGYIVQLRAGGSLLAEDNSSRLPAQGTFVTATLEYTSGFGHPDLGQPLEVRLSAPGVQANFDDVRLTASPAPGVCAEHLLVPFFLVDQNNAGATTTLFAVRNTTDGPVTASVEYFTVAGASQGGESVTLDPHEVRTVNLRTVPGLAIDPDDFARGFVRILGASDPDGKPVLEGDFFQIDADGNFATGDRLARQTELCRNASLRFLDFGAGTRLTIYVANPRGDRSGVDPPSFAVQVYDQAGNEVGVSQPVWTADHALELAAADLTTISFGSLEFDFTDSLGGTVYAEYSAFGRFSVGVSSQCEDQRQCSGTDCCPPGAPKAIAGGIHYPKPETPDCAAAISEALRTLDSFHYRNACQEAHGGPLPDAVLGAAVVDCQVDPPGSEGNVVVAVEACCPLP